MSRWEIQVKLNLSLKAVATVAPDPPGPLTTRVSESNFIVTEKRVTDVKLKFQLRDAGCPSKSFISAGAGSSPALDTVLTGRGSYHVTLPPSEIEDYSHLHWVLLEWKVICLKRREFHHKQRTFSLSSRSFPVATLNTVFRRKGSFYVTISPFYTEYFWSLKKSDRSHVTWAQRTQLNPAGCFVFQSRSGNARDMRANA